MSVYQFGVQGRDPVFNLDVFQQAVQAVRPTWTTTFKSAAFTPGAGNTVGVVFVDNKDGKQGEMKSEDATLIRETYTKAFPMSMMAPPIMLME